MSLIPTTLSATSSDRNNSVKAVNALLIVLYLGCLTLSIFLAIRDMGALHNTASKVWLFLLAALMPELYVLIHGLSTSTLGLGFFSETMPNTPVLSSPTSAGSTIMSSTPTDIKESVKKAAAALKQGIEKSVSSLDTST